MAPTTALDLAQLTIDQFAGSVDAAFTLVQRNQSLELTLVAVKGNPDGAGPESRRTPFSLILRADESSGHPIQNLRELTGDLHGLQSGLVAGVMVVRVLRPAGLPPGAYYQVSFS